MDIQVLKLAEETEKFLNNIPNFSVGLSGGKYWDRNTFPDLSFQSLKKNAQSAKQISEKINKLAQIKQLSAKENALMEVCLYLLEYYVYPSYCPANEDFYYLNFDITPYSYPLLFGWQELRAFAYDTPENVRKHIELMSDYPRFTQQLYDKVKTQAELGIYLAKDEIKSAVKALMSYAVSPENHPGNMRGKNGAQTNSDIEKEEKYFEEGKNNLLKTAEFISSDKYIKYSPEKIGLCHYEKGIDYYEYLKKFQISYNMDSAYLHEKGKEYMEQIYSRQAEIRRKITDGKTHEEFIESLKNTDRFFPHSPDSLKKNMTQFVQKTEKEMSKYFNMPIKTPWRVEKLPQNMEDVMTFGYYDDPNDMTNTGTYYFNGKNLSEKCQINAHAMMIHELMPGNHYRIACMRENKNMHNIFKKTVNNCYVYAWAGYAEEFAEENGFFDDLYDIYGKLESGKFISARLVVDTGLNALGWTKQQGIDYLVKNTFCTYDMAENEVLRYAADVPAQALSYRLGREKMKQIKEKYQIAAGERFDIKQFHKTVMDIGTVPMNILENYMDKKAKEEYL